MDFRKTNSGETLPIRVIRLATLEVSRLRKSCPAGSADRISRLCEKQKRGGRRL